MGAMSKILRERTNKDKAEEMLKKDKEETSNAWECMGINVQKEIAS